MPRSRFRLPRRWGTTPPRPARANGRSLDGCESDLGERRPGDEQSEPSAGAKSRSMAFPRSRELEIGFRRIDASGCAGSVVDGTLYDDADIAWLPVVMRFLRHSDFQ